VYVDDLYLLFQTFSRKQTAFYRNLSVWDKVTSPFEVQCWLLNKILRVGQMFRQGKGQWQWSPYISVEARACK